MLPVVVLIGYSTDRRAAAEDQYLLRSRQSRLGLGASLIDSELGAQTAVLRAFAGRPEIASAVDRRDTAALNAALAEVVRDNPAQIGTATILDRGGIALGVAPETPAAIGRDFSYRDYFQGLVAGGWQPFVSDVFQSTAVGTPYVAAIAVAIPGPDGPRGAAVMALNVATFTSRLSSFDFRGPVIMIDRHQRLISSSTGAISPMTDMSADPQVRQKVASGAARSSLQNGILKTRHVIGGTGWTLLASEPKAALIRSTGAEDLEVSLALGLAALVLLILFSRQYARITHQRGQLNAARGQLDALIDSMGEGLIMLDGDRRVVTVNAPAEAMLGIRREDAIGRPTEVMRAMTDLRRKGPAPDLENVDLSLVDLPLTFDLVGGEPARHVQAVLTAVRGGPSGDGIAVVLRDVTAERELEEAKDNLIAHVSHELRSPMSAILGFCELLLERDYPEAQRRQYLQHVQASAKRLTALLNDFLDIQRSESGREELNVVPVDVGEAISNAVASISTLPGADRVEVDHDTALPSVLADTGKLQQILLNLLTNAIKYSPDGGRISITTGAARSSVWVSVADEGLGIPPEARSRLFSKFYRVPRQGIADPGGTGLGLAITRTLIERMGGRITAESGGAGQGSKFTFTLPAAAPTRDVDRRSVLVVDDDVHFGTLLTERLDAAGYSVHRAARAETVVDQALAANADAVILDIVLPGATSGWDALSELKSNRHTASVPVIIVTVVDDADRGMAAGAAHYLLKPVDTGRIIEAVAEAVSPSSPDVLVVDDDDDFRASLAGALRAASYSVREARTAAEAVAAAREAPPGLVLLDLGLPDADGVEVVSRLRQHGAAPPVVIVSGRDLSTRTREKLRRQIGEVVAKDGSVIENVMQHVRR